MYCFEGNESNIYVAKDTEVEIRVDGGKWERVKLTGSLREPSATLNMPNEGKHVVEVRAINEEIALNMISTDGVFYKGQAPDVKPEAPIVSENTSGNQHQSSNITLQQSNKVNTLPATGNVVGSSLLASIGGLLAGVGIKLSKKKRK